MNRRRPEAVIQNHICMMLDHYKVCYSVTDASRFWSKDGNPRPSKVRRGWPDLTGCYRGRFFGLEVKVPGAYPKPVQKLCHAKIRANGGFVAVVRSWADCLELFSEVNRTLNRASPKPCDSQNKGSTRKEAPHSAGTSG